MTVSEEVLRTWADMSDADIENEKNDGRAPIYKFVRELAHELLDLRARAAAGKPNIPALVDRFLGWPLPKTFAPDCGISFDGRKPDAWNPSRQWPIGTNLFTADEARQMLEFVLAAAPEAEKPAPLKKIKRCQWCGRTTPYGIIPEEDCHQIGCPLVEAEQS